MLRATTTTRIAPTPDQIKGLQLSASQWTWRDAEALCDIKHQPFLGLRFAANLLKQDAVALLDLDQKGLERGLDWTTYVNMPATLTALGMSQRPSDFLKAELGKGKSMDEAQRLMDDYVTTKVKKEEVVTMSVMRFIFNVQRVLLMKMGQIQQARASPVRSDREKVIDSLAWHLADICGFDEAPLFLTATSLDENTSVGNELKILGCPIAVRPDLFVVKRHPTLFQGEKLVIIFEEDKTETQLSKHGHVAQILAEMLLLHYRNVVVHKLSESTVYCVRVVDTKVNVFSMSCTRNAIETICLGDVDVNAVALQSKLIMWSHSTNWDKDGGLCLVDKSQRREALNLLSRVREDVAK